MAKTNEARIPGSVKLEATKGHVLPISYKGRIVVMRPGQPQEIVLAELDYQSQIILQHAIDKKEVQDFVEPAPVKASEVKSAPVQK